MIVGKKNVNIVKRSQKKKKKNSQISSKFTVLAKKLKPGFFYKCKITTKRSSKNSLKFFKEKNLLY